MEDEDKHSLEGVEYGEEVRHDDRGLIDEEETERPRETEQEQQREGTHDPGSEGQQNKKQTQEDDKCGMRGLQGSGRMMSGIFNHHNYEKLRKKL